MCLECVYLFLKNYDCVVKEYYFILFKEKKKDEEEEEEQKGGPVGEKKMLEMCKREFGLVNRPYDVQFIYKTTIQKHYLKTKSKYMF